MPRRISPPRDQLDRLRQPLTEGEREVFDFFDELLPEAWEIYIQPHLNGLRPDFVILHPHTGIVVIEVKDWDLEAMEYEVVKEPGVAAPRLFASKGGKRFPLDAENPLNKIHLYRDEVLQLYCPSFEKDPKNSPRVVAGLVFFTRAERARVKELFSQSISHYGGDEPENGQKNPKRNNCRIGGSDDLSRRNQSTLRELIEFASYPDRGGMSEDVARDLRHWLEEPEFAAEQRTPLPLDDKQKGLATSRTPGGYRRIKGPAGSGKSQVLAARAAQLTLENPDSRVLIVSFNITILNYLIDLAVRWPRPGLTKVRSQVDVLNFHAWCKRLCWSVGAGAQYSRLWGNHFDGKVEDSNAVDDTVFEREISELVSRVLDQAGASAKSYDAILVDEGQDFRPEWWNCLRKTLKDDGEMLLVADASQDIYGNSDLWTEGAMRGCGFAGEWVQLLGSYRIPAVLLPLIRDFAASFLADRKSDPPQGQEDFLPALEGPCTLRWRQVPEGLVTATGLLEALRIAGIDSPAPVPFPDVTIVVSSKTTGKRIVGALEARNIRSIHTFDTEHEKADNRVERRKKLAFYKGDARVKVTTIHSFKGLETRALVICQAREDRGSANAELLYTAMTRLKRTERGSHLSIITDDPEFVSHGRTWPDFLLDEDEISSPTKSISASPRRGNDESH